MSRAHAPKFNFRKVVDGFLGLQPAARCQPRARSGTHYARRSDGLTFAHHVEVAGLDTAEADELLDRAEAEGWSTRPVRSGARRTRFALRPVQPYFPL
jgi:hypothetical protein